MSLDPYTSDSKSYNVYRGTIDLFSKVVSILAVIGGTLFFMFTYFVSENQVKSIVSEATQVSTFEHKYCMIDIQRDIESIVNKMFENEIEQSALVLSQAKQSAILRPGEEKTPAQIQSILLSIEKAQREYDRLTSLQVNLKTQELSKRL